MLSSKITNKSDGLILFCGYLFFFFGVYSISVCGTSCSADSVIMTGDYVSFMGTPRELLWAFIEAIHQQGLAAALVKGPIYLLQLPGVILSDLATLPKTYVAITEFAIESTFLAFAFSRYIKFLCNVNLLNLNLILASLIYCLSPFQLSVITNPNIVWSCIASLFLIQIANSRLIFENVYKAFGICLVCIALGFVLLMNLASYLGVIVVIIVYQIFYYWLIGFDHVQAKRNVILFFIFCLPLLILVGCYCLDLICVSDEIRNNVEITTFASNGNMLKVLALLPRWVLFSADPPLLPLFENGYIVILLFFGIAATGVAVSGSLFTNRDSDSFSEKRYYAVFGIMLAGAYVIKGNNAPFGISYELLYKIPYICVMFREPSTKFSMLFLPNIFVLFFVLMFSCHEAAKLEDSLVLASCGLRRLANLALLLLLLILLLIYLIPILNGSYFRREIGMIPRPVTSVPFELIEAARFAREKGAIMLTYPKSETYQHYFYGKDGMHSVDFLGVNFPWVKNGKTDYIGIKCSNNGLSAIYDLLCNGNLSDPETVRHLKILLKKEGVNVIALRNDMDHTNYGFKDDFGNSIQEVETALSSGVVAEFGKLSFRCKGLNVDRIGREQCFRNARHGSNFVVRLISFD